MSLVVMGKCECGCGNRNYLIFISKLFQLRWFQDYGDWFLYVHFGRRYFRFSSAGFYTDKTLK
jgi:hypothetical protein